MAISWRTASTAAILLVLILGACAGGGGDERALEPGSAEVGRADSGGDASLQPNSLVDEDLSVAGSGGSEAPDALGAPDDVPLSPAGSRVIKTAQVSIEVPRGDFGESLQRAIQAAQSAGGYVLTSEVGGRRSRAGSITIRVPSERFEATLGDLKGLGEVKGERISGEDVSEEFIDLEARLRNLEAQERVLLRLMDRAESVVATIRVQRELSRIQLEIERINGRLRFLEDQTAYSTITARLTEEGAAAPRAAGVLARAWEQAKNTTLAVLSGVIIGAGFLLPLLVLASLGWVIWKIVAPRFGKAPA